MLKRFLNDETGATAIEYGLIAAMLSVSIVGTLSLLQVEYVNMYDRIKVVVLASAPAP